MATAIRTKIDAELREGWLRTLDELISQIADWVRQEPEWSFETAETQELEEPLLGRYSVTIWSIHTPDGEVRLEPMLRDFLGRQFVELYAWPTLRRVHLHHDPDTRGWRIRTDSAIFLRQEWNRRNFILLVRDLIEAD